MLATLILLACQGPSSPPKASTLPTTPSTATTPTHTTSTPTAPSTTNTTPTTTSRQPSPWSAFIEICDGTLDEDADGLVDEDCAPSLFLGTFVPEASGDYTGAGLIDTMTVDLGRAPAVQQTYRSLTALGIDKAELDLNTFFAYGAVVHLNVEPSGLSAADYADPERIAGDLRSLGDAIARALVAAPDGRLLLTFGAEMNGAWTDWGCLPVAQFVALHGRAHDEVEDALLAAGVDLRRVRWVFGPDSRGTGGCPSPADYFPGNDQVDLVGLSAYRSGTDSVSLTVLEPVEELLDGIGWPEPWRQGRVVVLQTGSRAANRGPWSTDLFQSLLADPSYAGLIWFHAADWAVIDSSGPLADYADWVDAAAALPAPDLRLEGLFDPYFWDVDRSHARYPEIQALRAAGVTSGCATSPPQFCPDAELLRADAAVLLERAFGADAGLALFHTERPDEPVTRMELAAEIGRLAGRVGPPPSFAFTDLDGSPEALRVQDLAFDTHVDGCEPGLFCPDRAANRSDAARWIVRVADLP